jgi:hypothetical protein
MWYLKSYPGEGILYSNHGYLRIEGYTDVDWDGRSTTEEKVRSMASGLCELMWLRLLLTKLKLYTEYALQL